MIKFVGIIPARYASSRFPGKPLVLLGGKPVIQRVYEQVSRVLADIYVATDDERISQIVEKFGGRSIMTSPHHKSGTDRINEAVDTIKAKSDVVVNIQGDEPFILPSQIETVCRCFEDPQTQIATLGKPFTNQQSFDDLCNPNTPKVITDNHGYAMYFSRSIIPFIRGKEHEDWIGSFPFMKHIGLYAYRTDVLKELAQLPQTSLEMAESLEQLRWLQSGYRIKVGVTNEETIGIDTPQDIEKAETFLKNLKLSALR